MGKGGSGLLVDGITTEVRDGSEVDAGDVVVDSDDVVIGVLLVDVVEASSSRYMVTADHESAHPTSNQLLWGKG